MNSLLVNSYDKIDTSVVFTKLKELFPKVKKIESVTVLKEFAELAYKDDEMDVKFEFTSPHTVKMTYHGDKFVSIDDEEFGITLGNKTEDEAMLDYICYLDFYWERYIEGKVTNISERLRENIDIIKSNLLYFRV